MGNRPQQIINDQVLKNADILVGIFWTRIGTPSGKAISGTVEEIEEHIVSGKPTMLYFSKKPVVPDSIDSEQYSAVKKLKKEYQQKGLTTDFDSVEDFKARFQRHLSMKLNEEEYQLENQEIHDFSLNESELNLKNKLSQDAIILLTEAVKDKTGEIMKVGHMGGFTISTNERQLNEDFQPRTKVKWEAAMNELLDFELIAEVGYEGEIFQVTDKGDKLADELE